MPPRPAPWLPWAALGLALLILAGSITAAALQLRAQTRAQIARRDAEILRAMVSHQLSREIADPLGAVLDSSTQKGVLAVRVFDAAGRFSYAIPAHVTEAQLDGSELAELRALRPLGRYRPEIALDSIFLPRLADPVASGQAGSAPVLEVLIPLHAESSPQFLGVAQYLLDGQAIRREFAQLDANLARQLAVVFVAAGAVLLLAIGYALRRLQLANRLLEGRTTDLLRANQELALAAKSSAVGAVTSHLIHGLKSPLAGLQQFVTRRAVERPGEADTEWFHAVATTKRMQVIIADVVRVLREEESGARYELSLQELADMIANRSAGSARAAGVQLKLECAVAGQLSNRDANLVSLIVENLIQNGIQASPPNSTVCAVIQGNADAITIDVSDSGPGLPPDIKKNLFSPCRSTKAGGSGIGLAISKQLAAHLGAELRLRSDSPVGCVFQLALPAVAEGGQWRIARRAP